jgi:hypothetical protein
MDIREASAMTEASGLTRNQDGRENSSGEGRRAELDHHPLQRAAERLRKITLAAPLPSLFVAFLVGVLVARRR